MAMTKSNPPRVNELELSLFGPGYGECAVLHLGSNEWMIVDSCLNESQSLPVAIEYLHLLDIDIDSDVKFIVASHWHDDHLKGLSELVRRARSAKFVCSDALKCDEFYSLIHCWDATIAIEGASGTGEFSRVLDILKERNGRHSPDTFAQERTLVFRRDDPSIEVLALSPSAETISRAKSRFAELRPQIGTPTRRALPAVSPNDTSVVLSIATPTISFLLGSDLPVVGSNLTGWRAVCGLSSPSPSLAAVYKVAHHGSKDADSDEIWSALLLTDPHSLIAPWVKGGRILPTENDLKRIRTRSKNVFSTVWPPDPKQKSGRPTAVDAIMKRGTRSRIVTTKRPGHIRVRVPIDGRPNQISVQLFDGAKQL